MMEQRDLVESNELGEKDGVGRMNCEVKCQPLSGLKRLAIAGTLVKVKGQQKSPLSRSKSSGCALGCTHASLKALVNAE